MSLLLRSVMLMGSAYGMRQAAKLVGDLDIDDYLGRVGLARKTSLGGQLLPAAGLVAIGALVGAGTALLLAPSSGTALRSRVSGRVDELKSRLDDLGERGRSAIENTHSNSTTTHSTHS